MLVNRTHIFGRPEFHTSEQLASIKMGRYQSAVRTEYRAVPIGSQIERSLKVVFSIRLSVKQLCEIVPRLKQIVDSPTTKTRRRWDTMEWIQATWILIEPILPEITQKRDLLN
jgi:hypothetical protein